MLSDMQTAAQAETKNIDVLEWRACERNTLLGFAKIKVNSWGLVIDGVAIHKKNDRKWAQLPSRPQIGKDGTVMKDEAGKSKYAIILEFDDKRRAWDFSDAVVAAVARKAAQQ
jgi:hypothetical protein